MLNQAVIDRSVSISPIHPDRLAKWLAVTVAAGRSRRLQARYVRELRQLEPHMLRDIGIDAAALFATPARIAMIDNGD